MRPLRLLTTTILLAIGIVVSTSVAGSAHTAYGDWGPGGPWENCFIYGEIGHSPSVYDADTVEATMFAQCTGVRVKVRYKVDGGYTTDVDTDTGCCIYAAHVNGGYDILDYSDHDGRNTSGTTWVGARIH